MKTLVKIGCVGVLMFVFASPAFCEKRTVLPYLTNFNQADTLIYVVNDTGFPVRATIYWDIGIDPNQNQQFVFNVNPSTRVEQLVSIIKPGVFGAALIILDFIGPPPPPPADISNVYVEAAVVDPTMGPGDAMSWVERVTIEGKGRIGTFIKNMLAANTGFIFFNTDQQAWAAIDTVILPDNGGARLPAPRVNLAAMQVMFIAPWVFPIVGSGFCELSTPWPGQNYISGCLYFDWSANPGGPVRWISEFRNAVNNP